MSQMKSRRFALLAAATFCSTAMALTCYVQTQFNVKVVCEDNCQHYSLCPGKVLCAIGSVNLTTSPVATATWACQTFTGGTGTCRGGTGTCTGGTPIPSTMSVIIPVQDCKGDCV